MILEIRAEIIGNFDIEPNIEFKKKPYAIKVFLSEDKQKCFISISKSIVDFQKYLPKMEVDGEGQLSSSFPENDFFDDITELFQHIESFGAIDKNIEKILWENPTVRWIPENENELLSPLDEYTKNSSYQYSKKVLSKKWMSETIRYKNQLGDLYFPFSFLREGIIKYHSFKYQESFCYFYMMLEYFFCTTSHGINNNAWEKDSCLKNCLGKTIKVIETGIPKHYSWLTTELSNRHKTLNEEGLLFVLNRFRDELSHAVKREKNRNPFKEKEFQSLAFIAMTLCMQVSIKMRLLPFVCKSDRDSFLEK